MKMFWTFLPEFRYFQQVNSLVYLVFTVFRTVQHLMFKYELIKKLFPFLSLSSDFSKGLTLRTSLGLQTSPLSRIHQ